MSFFSSLSSESKAQLYCSASCCSYGLEMFILLSCMSLASSWKCSSAEGAFFLLLVFFCVRQVRCSVVATLEDELAVGADLLFLEWESDGALGIGSRIVLGMVSKLWVTMCFKSSSSWLFVIVDQGTRPGLQRISIFRNQSWDLQGRMISVVFCTGSGNPARDGHVQR